MSELGRQIEHVVGPIRASLRRKDAMRRELLAHLKASYEEERAKGQGEAAATRAALERFGPADDLRAELQASVPAIERILYTNVPFAHRLHALRGYLGKRSGESPARHAARSVFAVALAVLALDVMILGPLLAFDALTGRPTLSASQLGAFAIAFQAVPAICGFLYILSLHGLTGAVTASGSALPRMVRAVGWYGLACAATLSGWIGMRAVVGGFGGFMGAGSSLLPVVATVALTPIMLTWIGLACLVEQRRQQERERLLRLE